MKKFTLANIRLTLSFNIMFQILGTLLDMINTNMRNFLAKKSYDDLYKLTMFSGVWFFVTFIA